MEKLIIRINIRSLPRPKVFMIRISDSTVATARRNILQRPPIHLVIVIIRIKRDHVALL
jgi:hypothetical protein